MSTSDAESRARVFQVSALDDAVVLSRLQDRLPPLLSVIAGMVDLTGFFTLGKIFTAHITGNLVVVAAAAVRGSAFNLTQALAIPAFILAVAGMWLYAQASNPRGRALARRLLVIQALLLTGLLLFSVITRPSTSPDGLMAGIAAMIAVCAMACQYVLFRVALPGAISTAVMTGNLTNTVLSLMDRLSPNRPLMNVDSAQLRRSLLLLFGFLMGCVVAAVATSVLADWAWSLPAALAALAVVLP